MTPVPGALRGRMSEADYQEHEARGQTTRGTTSAEDYQGHEVSCGLPGARREWWTTRGTKSAVDYQGHETLAWAVIAGQPGGGCLRVGPRVQPEDGHQARGQGPVARPQSQEVCGG